MDMTLLVDPAAARAPPPQASSLSIIIKRTLNLSLRRFEIF